MHLANSRHMPGLLACTGPARWVLALFLALGTLALGVDAATVRSARNALVAVGLAFNVAALWVLLSRRTC